MKKLYFFLFFPVVVFSQVGINTTNPNAQLDIKSSNEATPSNTDGLLIPKVDAFPATNPTVAQQGMLVYLKNDIGATLKGFYYWNNTTTTWIPIKGSDTGTLDQAYDFGGAGLGKTITADAGAVLINGTDGLVSTGTLGNGAIAPSGAGTKMFWNPRKAAFRAGQVNFSQWDDVNIGIYSFAFGESTEASGDYSAAFGFFTRASGDNATSFGGSNIASGNLSTAFGNATIASGNRSTAFGQSTTSSGFASTAFGIQNTAPSFGETVFGIGATIYSPSLSGATQFRAANATDRLFVIGNALDVNNNDFPDASERRDALIVLKNGLTRLPSTTNAMITAADGKAVVTKEYLQSTASGTLDQAYDFGGAGLGNTITADAGAVLIDGTDGLVATGTIGSGAITPSGAGTRMVWNPRKAAFRAGIVTGTQWDDVNIGNNSVAFGNNSTASGFGSFAGSGASASGTNSFAFGASASATGQSSFAFGQGAAVTGGSQDAIAIGIGCISSVSRAISIGSGNNASNFSSVAIGSTNTSSGFQSVALGSSNSATGSRSMAFGMQNTTPSFGETVMGIGATTYVPSINGDTQFRTANATDRLFVIGNAIDANNNNIVDAAEQSDAMVVLKNGLTRLPSTTNAMIDAADGKAIITKEWVQTNAINTAWGTTGNSGTNATTNFIGTTDNTDLVIRTNNTDNFRIKNDGRIEIGNNGTNPTYLGSSSLSQKMFVASEGINNNIVFQSSNNTNDPISIFYGLSRGTISSPTILNSGQFISFNYFSGFDGTQYIPATSISSQVDGTTGLNKMPGALHFATTPIGGSSPITRMTIKNSGNVGIGTSTPLDKLHIVGNIRMVDGNQAAGKVLASDANGTATWQNASANAWGLVGNSGTNATTNFIGTTDDIDVVFKRNNIMAGLFGTTNSSFGLNAFNTTATGTNNTAIGATSLGINTTGSNNTAVGFNALSTINQGSNNTGIGADTATTSTLLTNATAIGYKATAGSSNSLVLGSINGLNGATASVNVGIGTSTPQSRLEIVDENNATSSTVRGNLHIMTNNAQNIDIGGALSLGGYNNDAATVTRVFATIEGRKSNTTTGNNSGYLAFKTNNGVLAEKMRITATGDVGIGTALPGGQFELSLNEGRKPGTTTWTIVSDQRLKTINGNYTKGLTEILQLNPIRFNYKNVGERKFEQKVLDTEFEGFIAQEVQPLFPDAVGTDADGFLNFNIHPVLIASVNAFKELNVKYEDLKKKNEALENKLNALMSRVEALEKK